MRLRQGLRWRLRARFPEVDLGYASRHSFNLMELALEYKRAREDIDPSADPEVLAGQIDRAQIALDALKVEHDYRATPAP